MKPMTVINPALPVPFKVASMFSELHEPIEEVQTLVDMVEHGYAWYSPRNKQSAQEAVEALGLALQMQLVRQTKLHAEQLFDWVTKDMAEQVYHLAAHQLGYQGEITYRQYQPAPGQIWRELIRTTPYGRQEWVFAPLEHFAKLIPLHALRAMQLLNEAGIQPTAYWVADKVETRMTQVRSLDPILCVQFGQWLAGLAFWL